MNTAIQIEVRPTELDSMGHVNNAKFLEYMEWSREDWYNKVELPFDTFTALGSGDCGRQSQYELPQRGAARPTLDR